MTARFSRRLETSYAADQFLRRTSGLNYNYVNAYKNLIDGLVKIGLWRKIDGLYVFATSTEANAVLNLKDRSYTATKQAAPTFVAAQGYTGVAFSYFTTGFIPSSAGGAMSLDSATLGVYNRSSRTSNANTYAIGCNDATKFCNLQNRNGGGLVSTINCAGGSFVIDGSTNVQGMNIVARNNSSTTVISYKNGAQVTSSAQTSTGLPTVEIYLGNRNNNGSQDAADLDQHAIEFFGGGMSATEVSQASSLFNAYMTAIGANVY